MSPTKNRIDEYLPGGFSPDFLETLRNLIAYFILRQQLVVLAMVELNPRSISKSARINVQPYVELQFQRMLALKQAMSEKNTENIRTLSIWKHDWEYFAH